MNNYNLGYIKGIEDTLAHSSVTYKIGHTHIGSCYRTVKTYCQGRMQYICDKPNYDGRGWDAKEYRCDTCGRTVVVDNNPVYCYKENGSYQELTCTKDTSEVQRTSTDDTLAADEYIISAEIVF